MIPEPYRKVVQGLSGAIKGLRLYPLQHPAIERQLQTLHGDLSALLVGKQGLKMGILEETLFLEDHLFTEPGASAEELVRILEHLGVPGLEFLPGISVEELRTFLGLLTGGGGDFSERLAAARVRHMRALTGEDEQERPRQVYGRALKVVDTIFHDVRMGKIPSSTEAIAVVKSMVELTLSDPHALFALSMLKDYDNYTFTHSVNVSVLALAVGRAGNLPEDQLRTLGFGGLLHDIGKLKVDIDIINKPGRLTEGEFEQIKQHPVTGADTVTQMEGVTQEVIDIVRCHHLRYDRTGYPADARGRTVSPLADITAVADTYDAITTLRSYQRPITPRKAIARLRELTGSSLHPQFTEDFIASLGTYPVGSLVRLDNSEIGLVVSVDTADPDAVQLKILFDEDGRKLPEPRRIDLQGEATNRIVAEVDPFSKGVEVTDYFD